MKGNIIKYDVGKVTIDYEREQDIPEDKRTSHLRYNLINGGFGLAAKAVHRAISYKGSCCNPYTLAISVEFFKLRADIFSIYIDDELAYENFPVVLMGVNNIKYGAAGMNMSPLSVTNDGMMELYMCTKHNLGLRTLFEFQDDAMKRQGIHAYHKDFAIHRGKFIKIVNHNYPKKKKTRNSICSRNS